MRFETGTVKIDFELAYGIGLTIDGKVSDTHSIDILTTTRLTIGDAGSLVVRPPEGSGRSIAADLAAAEEELSSKLKALGVSSYSAAVTRSERAAAAARELKALRSQIVAACPGDPTIETRARR